MNTPSCVPDKDAATDQQPMPLKLLTLLTQPKAAVAGASRPAGGGVHHAISIYSACTMCN